MHEELALAYLFGLIWKVRENMPFSLYASIHSVCFEWFGVFGLEFWTFNHPKIKG